MSSQLIRLPDAARCNQSAPGVASRHGYSVGIALCALAILSAVPDHAQGRGGAAKQASPVNAVSGGGVFFLETGVPEGGNLIEHISINARLDADGIARGEISSTIAWFSVPPPGGHPDPFGTGDPIHYEVTDLTVIGNTAFIAAVVVFAPDFPEFVGTMHYFEVADNGGPPNSGDTVFIDGFDLPPLAAGNYTVR